MTTLWLAMKAATSLTLSCWVFEDQLTIGGVLDLMMG
jgi:hypothetical protein